MNLSMILTVNNRSHETTVQVAASLVDEGNQPDELVVVLDRPTDAARKAATRLYAEAGSEGGFPVRFIEIAGAPGWLGPARAWNHGFHAATGEWFYCISSEVTQNQGNLDRAREMIERHPNAAIFGACTNSEPTQQVLGAKPGFLAGSSLPRPLGFIVAMPAEAVRAVEGFDEAFMDGFWYDDDDFFLRLWRHGLDFVFDDKIAGVHLDHPRPDLETPEGQAKIQRNAALMLKKHGKTHAWNDLIRLENYDASNGLLVWSHV